MTMDWLNSLVEAKKYAVASDGLKKVHFSFANGQEMVEEYDIKTNSLTSRKWKVRTGLVGKEKWEYEIGEDITKHSLLFSEGLCESHSNPIFMRIDNLKSFQWRIRNLPYSLENYHVSINDSERRIVIKTVNKKYFKKFNIPDLDRMNLALDEKCLRIAHANNTLIISYDKPAEVLDVEKTLQKELKKVNVKQENKQECNPS